MQLPGTNPDRTNGEITVDARPHNQITPTEQSVLNWVRQRYVETNRPVPVPEICSGLLLSPDVVYRAVTFLVQARLLTAAEESRDRRLELASSSVA